MKYLSGEPNYDKFPHIDVRGYPNHAVRGWKDTWATIAEKVSKKDKHVLVIDTYHGVDHEEIVNQLITPLHPKTIIIMDDAKLPEKDIHSMLERNITDDRVFGVIAPHKLIEFFDVEKLASLKEKVSSADAGLTVVLGHGASLVTQGDTFVYADLARWEIQQRFRSGKLGNWGAENEGEDILRKYKRSFFIEWRVFDQHKAKLLPKVDFLLDTNTALNPKLVTGEALNAGLRQATTQPFRLVPFFDEGVWGGQWMKEVCDLDKSKRNYAWCFDCVPEENSLLLKYDDVVVEIPSLDLVLTQPRDLLGEKVHARFGTEFPIRFDFLDTMEGQHLSLQVHPLTEYIQSEFGMHYTQDESYYMLDAGPDASVYLGTKTSTAPDDMMADLEAAQRGERKFDDERFINQFPAKKHDHFLIPAGTIHCSGSDSMVLEISATPYIFTFKLWDWDRLGLDGLPRPVHLEHGKEVIQWDRDTKWCTENLVNNIIPISQGDGWREERTGLHEKEFIETRRHWFTKAVEHDTEGLVNVLNLVQGRAAVVESPDSSFEPFEVHYAETFIIPAQVGRYRIRPLDGDDSELATIKAYVRT